MIQELRFEMIISSIWNIICYAIIYGILGIALIYKHKTRQVGQNAMLAYEERKNGKALEKWIKDNEWWIKNNDK